MLKECCIKWAVGDLRTSQYKQCGRYAERDVQGIMGIQRHGSQLSLGIAWIITKGSVKVRKGMLAIARLHGDPGRWLRRGRHFSQRVRGGKMLADSWSCTLEHEDLPCPWGVRSGDKLGRYVSARCGSPFCLRAVVWI